MSFIRLYNKLKFNTSKLSHVTGTKCNCGNKQLQWNVFKDGSISGYNGKPAYL